ncbi:MAG TPA: T9SS type A sorting domain-containing protein, partial [Flavobacterium sp.]
RYISLLGTSGYGSNTFIDEVKVTTVLNNDLLLSSIAMDDIISGAGSIPVTGVIKNFGANPITSLDINWQADGGTIQTQTLTGLNIAQGQNYTFTHDQQWTAAPGAHDIAVWVANPNGIADADATNNQISKSLSVASNSTSRVALYEKFTSSTCAPCAGFNGGFFSPFYQDNHEDFTLINYQVNWPGAGDPYYTSEIGTRVGYYNINAAPTLLVDAKEGTTYSIPGLENELAQANASPAFFAVVAEHTIVGNQITVDIDITPYLSGAFTLRTVVVEKLTTGNIASNGETEFKNVAMKMMPSAVGMVMNFTHDVPQSVQLVSDLTPTNVEELTDLEVVVFIQQDSSKKIMQSAYATNALSNGEFAAASTLKLYPNPTSGIVKISTDENVDVTISDLTGKVIFTATDVTNQTEIDLSSFESGIYIAKVVNGETQHTQKIILK